MAVSPLSSPRQEPHSAARARSTPAPGSPLVLRGDPLALRDLVAVARHRRPVALADAPELRRRLAASRATVDRAVHAGDAVYGVTTRLGGLADTVLPAAQTRELQRTALWTHATGAGAPIPAEEVRAAMLARVCSHLRGVSGVRVELVKRLVALLNAGATPVVREYGSIGASGDLVPLAAIAGAVTGHEADWLVEMDGVAAPAPVALRRLGLAPLPLEAKEALAMINGTSTSAGVAALCTYDARALLAPATVPLLAVERPPSALRPYVWSDDEQRLDRHLAALAADIAGAGRTEAAVRALIVAHERLGSAG